MHDWATVLQQEGDLVEAHKLAERGENAFPEQRRRPPCYNLLQQIEAKSSQINTERVWNEPLAEIQVRYRNVTKVFFRVVPESYEARLKIRPVSARATGRQRAPGAAGQDARAPVVRRPAGHRGLPGADGGDRSARRT